MVVGATTFYADSTSRRLYPCPHGYYGSTFGDCNPCQLDGFVSPPGRPGIRSKIDSCVKCGSGLYYSDTSRSCEACNAGMYRIPYTFFDNSEACASCPRGKYAKESGSIECTPCDKGTYTSSSASTQCDKCEAGKYLNATEGKSKYDCRFCPKDETSLLGAVECSPCSAGKYMTRSFEAGAVCENCPAGRYLEHDGGTSLQDCSECKRGRYANEGSVNCTFCPKGYTSMRRSSACEPCSPGTYNGEYGSEYCKKCSEGKYILDEGSQSCLNCPAGSYSEVTASPVCSYCPGGKFSSEVGANTSKTCKDCEAGKFSVIGSTQCTLVPPGQYTNGTSVKDFFLPCPAGTFQSESGSTFCRPSPPGRYSLAGAAVPLKCPRGTVNSVNGSTSIKDCELCPPGKSTIQEGSSQCVYCDKNYFSVNYGDICLSCKEPSNCANCGSTMTNNLDYTDCVLDDELVALSQTTLVNVLFGGGLALYCSGAIAVSFVAVCVVLQVNRAKYKDTLAMLSWPQIVLKSGVPGFTFWIRAFLDSWHVLHSAGTVIDNGVLLDSCTL